MFKLLMHSGLMNATLWVGVLACLAVLVSSLRTPAGPRHGTPVPRFLTSSLFLVLLLGGTFLNLGYGLYRAYSSPRDLMQDIVSAQEFLAGRSLYPDRMNKMIQHSLEQEPPRQSLFWWSPSLRAQEDEAREKTYTEHWVQAHPPLLTMFVALLVAPGGVLGAQAAFLVLSLAALVFSLYLIGRGLELHFSRRAWLLIMLLLLGAEPIVNTLRCGQSGLLLGLLIVVGWYALRHGRPVLAGVAIALAAALKMYPGLLLVYLLVRHRRAFVAAMATLVVVVVLIGTLTGWETFAEYAATTHEVVNEYEAFPNNLSLLGLSARTLGTPGKPGGKEQVFFFALVAVVVAAATWLVLSRTPRQENGTGLDEEFSLFVALMPLLSPIGWDHFLDILLLPMAVVGKRALTPVAPWPATLGFFAIATLLCIPDTSFSWALTGVEGRTLRLLVTLLIQPVRTYALIALGLWLGALVVRAHTAPPGEGRASLPSWGPLLSGVLVVLGLAHVAPYVPGEPYFNGDETRHLMTGVYFRDLFLDLPVGNFRDYSIRYYAQYPALGLLVWPPFFYFVEGIWMLILGTCFLAGQVLVGLFAAMACVYLFLLADRTHGRRVAALAALFLGLSPLFFEFSSRVMLEVPALAWGLMAAYHCHRYLEEERRLDLALCCLATALCALTRFDGVFLAPFFLVWLAGAGRLRLLLRREVLLGIAGAVLLVAPFYALTAIEMGGAHLKAVREGTGETSTRFLAGENFVFYPLCIPKQIGWFLAVPALIGFLAALSSARRPASWPYLALMAATYVTFTPMAELEARHALYWVPALAVFAADGCQLITECLPARRPVVLAPLCGVILVGTGWQAWQREGLYVRGYEEAARYVIAENRATPVCLFDGFLNGDFIYQVHRHDPARRLWVLRGDKLFYGMLSDPHGGYAEWAENEKEVLRLIDTYDPEFIVVEEPQIFFDLHGARLLRQVLRDHPDRFTLKETFRIASNHGTFRGKQLLVYRNGQRNPKRADLREIKMLGLGGSLRVGP
jgi:hypothetical protein